MENIFGSVVTAMATPFDGELHVDYNKLAELTDCLFNSGSDDVLVTGTTGESPTLTGHEKVKIYKSVVEAAAKRGKVIAGTGVNSTRETVELTRAAADAGVDGIMLVVPYYNKPPQEGLYKHFKEIARSVSLPIMLYNVPGRTSVNLTPDTTLKLAEIDNVVAIKEASGNLDQVSAICREAPPGFAVYSGDDSMTLPVLSVGGYGVVSIASHFVGIAIKEMVTAFKEGKIDDAVRQHQKLMPLFKALFMLTNPVPLKAALALTGRDMGEPRLPLISLPEDMRLELKALLSKYGLTNS